jgi:hypothetical protein
MTKSELLDAIIGRAPKQKDFTAAAEKLVKSDVLENFINSNGTLVSGVRPSEIANFLMLSANKFLEKRVGPIIAKNVYDEYAVVFALCLFSSTNKQNERNVLTKMFMTVLADSSKFDMYVRKGSRNMRVSSEGYLIELFWLIPLFCNVQVLLKIDPEEFIEENEQINSADGNYAEGYASFTTGNIVGIDKLGFKQFMHDGLVALAHSKAA